MDRSREQIYRFIMERVEEDRATQAQVLLEGSFLKQAKGTFTKENAAHFALGIQSLAKPEAAEEVKSAVEHLTMPPDQLQRPFL